MDITLSDEQSSYISEQVRSGLFRSADEVIGASLQLLKERDADRQRRRDELRREIQIGIDQIDQGLTAPFDEEALARIEAKGRARLAARTRADQA